ncbi:MAG TPA: TonB-dependent receptor [Phaeodactylibacter sp.]|nr:TonB-dependent receptor [Phaeodactylibacter sp.]
MNKLLFLLAAILLPGFGLRAQLLLVQGTVKDAGTGRGIPNAHVDAQLADTYTDENGRFELELAADLTDIRLTIFHPDYEQLQKTVTVKEFEVIDLGDILLKPADADEEDTRLELGTITLEDLESQEESSQEVSGLLTASRDLFVSTAAYTFGSARFRIRGYDSENTTISLNGVPVNRLENGRPYWSAWGGLNDVTRNRHTQVGLAPMGYSFNGIGGATTIDTRALSQRKQLRVSYSSSNRSYRNRLMATWSSGPLKNGWAVSVSGSRRWAQEGYVEGTFYDAWSYFLSIDKKFGESQRLNLTVLGAPIRRGRSTAAIAELYQLTGTHYYNSYWGFQNGKKRNSRVSTIHQPIAILRHDWNFGKNGLLTTAVSFQTGRNGSTALDWYDARDPRPNYYRYLPSFLDDGPMKELVTQAWINDQTVQQLDWDELYQVNYESYEEIENANGTGETVAGRRSKYILEERRYDSKELNFQSLFQMPFGKRLDVSAALGYRMYQGDNYKLVNDLLGGEFYVDINRFAERDFPDNPDAAQNDLNNPNRILKVGDRFGYDYNPNIHKAYSWAQLVYHLPRIDFSLGAQVSNTRFWREGDMKSGLFPDNSFGKSEVQSFLNYGVKGGLLLKINNRNYLSAYGAYLTRAPFFRNAYLSPRTRDQIVEGLSSEEITSGELNYIYRAPALKFRATGFYTKFRNGTRVMSFFNDEEIASDIGDETISLGFVNFALTKIGKRHMGAEIAVEWHPTSFLELDAVAAIGQYIYDTRPTATIVTDNNPSVFVKDRTIYLQNYYLPGMPQSAYTLGLRYNSKKYWFATFNLNYFDGVWLDVNPNRRTEEAVSTLRPGSDAWKAILGQDRGEPAVTLDFFGGKSFKFGDYFIYLNLGVSNILDNQDFITGGYEQLRFDFASQDPGRFPNRYYFYYGRTYFLNISFRM